MENTENSLLVEKYRPTKLENLLVMKRLKNLLLDI